jgi:acetyl esterase/lipase
MKTRLPLLLAVLSPWILRPAGADIANYEIRPDVVYGHKMGMALTLDAIKPRANANGAGVMFIVSGGWVSAWVRPEALLTNDMNKALGFTDLLDKGYALFLVRHGSSPLFKVPECVDDVRRASRFVHQNAAQWGVDPARLGVYGASAGGHLSLMLGTTGDDGKPEATDPLEKTGSRVAAVVAIFPPSELKSYLESESFRKQFPALQFDAANWKPVSPIEQITPDDAPTLLLHGDQDTLVPDSHSRALHQAFREKSVATELVIFPGAGHGFGGEDRARARQALIAWFDKHLSGGSDFSLAGKWLSRATLPDGDEFPATMTFTQDGSAWKGHSESDRGDRDLEAVTVEGKNLGFEVHVERDGEPIVVRVKAAAEAPNRLAGTWSVHRKDGGEELFKGNWQATREATAATPTPPPASIAGEWGMAVALGDNMLDYTLRLTAEGNALKGTLISPRSGEHPIESTVVDKESVKLRIKREYEGNALTFLYTGRLENGALKGSLTIEGQESEVAGTWTAKKK